MDSSRMQPHHMYSQMQQTARGTCIGCMCECMYEVADVGAGLEKDIRREKVRTTLFRRLPHALSCLFEGEQGSPASPQQTSKRKKKKKGAARGVCA